MWGLVVFPWGAIFLVCHGCQLARTQEAVSMTKNSSFRSLHEHPKELLKVEQTHVEGCSERDGANMLPKVIHPTWAPKHCHVVAAIELT